VAVQHPGFGGVRHAVPTEVDLVNERRALALAAVAVVGGVALWGMFSTRAGSQALQGGYSPPPASVRPAPVPKGYRPVFDARFSGSALDTSVWATCYPWAKPRVGCSNFANTEYQWYLSSQDQVSGGTLRLVAQHVPTAGRDAHNAPRAYDCRSGMVTTYPSFRFEYGFVQVVARVPNGADLWSALWLAAANLKWPPEIDILEQWANRSGLYFHPAGGRRGSSFPATADLSVGWHIFSLLWTPSQLTWYIDGQPEWTVREDIPHQPMYFIANVAEYRSPHDVSAPCTGTMFIRSVKVWQA